MLFAVIGFAGLPRAQAAGPVDALTLVEAQAFLDRYLSSSKAQSAAFFDLYSDRAVIWTRIEGAASGTRFVGSAYKSWGRTLVRERRAALDASVFHDARVEQRGARLLIRAQRYSSSRCYWDANYQVGIEPEGGAYRILEERLTTQPAAHCTPGAPASPPAPNALRSPVLDPTAAAPTAGPPPAWRARSADDIAVMALKLAQAAAAKTATPNPTDARAVAPQGATSTAAAPPAIPSALWLTP